MPVSNIHHARYLATSLFHIIGKLRSDGANLSLKIVQFLLEGRVLLCHFLILLLPLIAFLLESLDLALEVASFDVGLAEPGS